jgi:exodeoxyribonuclease-3
LLVAGGVDREVREWEKTSDHAPTWIELAPAARAPKAAKARAAKAPKASKAGARRS